jgi:hypothetical protein
MKRVATKPELAGCLEKGTHDTYGIQSPILLITSSCDLAVNQKTRRTARVVVLPYRVPGPYPSPPNGHAQVMRIDLPTTSSYYATQRHSLKCRENRLRPAKKQKGRSIERNDGTRKLIDCFHRDMNSLSSASRCRFAATGSSHSPRSVLAANDLLHESSSTDTNYYFEHNGLRLRRKR